MAKPIYIICARSGIEDKRTNLVSMFNILEKVTISTGKVQVPAPTGTVENPIVVQTFPFRILAVWMRTPEDDEEGVFEAQIVITGVGGEEKLLGQTEMTLGRDKQTLRLMSDVEGPMPFGDTPGIVLIEARLRRKGSEEWNMRQTYPIIVDVESPPDS